jgi:hypothetical protein
MCCRKLRYVWNGIFFNNHLASDVVLESFDVRQHYQHADIQREFPDVAAAECRKVIPVSQICTHLETV